MGVIQSMGRVGSALDNAVSESFNSVLKVEYVHRHTFATRTEARLRIATWITGFYNTRRRHSAAGGHPHQRGEHAHCQPERPPLAPGTAMVPRRPSHAAPLSSGLRRRPAATHAGCSSDDGPGRCRLVEESLSRA